MRRRPKAARAATLVVALASMLLLAGPGRTTAAADSCDGVWVVVDARAAGGTITTRCAPGDPTSGLEALTKAEHDYTFVPRIPGMVCTIDARPDPCNNAPADAYWSYWYAEAGATWAYATTGAGTRDPAPGSVEGWRFGDGTAPPGVAPPANAPEPEPAPAAPAEPTQDTTSTGDRSSDDGAEGRADTGSEPSRSELADDGGEPASDGEAEATASDADGVPSGPSWQPGPVETGEWADPPRTTVEDPAAGTGQAPVAGGSPADEDGMVLTARRSEPPSTDPPLGAALGVGLLAGLGALTWRQQRRRNGARS